MLPEDTRYQYTSLQGKWIPVSIVLKIVFNQLWFEKVIVKDDLVVRNRNTTGKIQFWESIYLAENHTFSSIDFLHRGSSNFVIDICGQVLQPF